jgi:hypothetical protein
MGSNGESAYHELDQPWMIIATLPLGGPASWT